MSKFTIGDDVIFSIWYSPIGKIYLKGFIRCVDDNPNAEENEFWYDVGFYDEMGKYLTFRRKEDEIEKD